MTGLHLVMTTDAVGGVWQYSIELARALGALGCTVTLGVLGPAPSRAQAEEAAAIDAIDFVETGLPLDWLCDEAAPVLAAGAAIAALARRCRADIVQLNMPTLAAGGAFAQPVVAVTHGCVSTWWAAARCEPLARRYHWHRALTGRGLRQADLIVAPTGSHASTVQSHYRLPDAPVTVLNGRQHPPAALPAARHDCAFTAGRLWDAVKNIAVLDAAAARLQVPFYAAGAETGPHGERIAIEHLHPLGFLDAPSLAQRLAARPVFVSAARFEPFGLAVLEAAQRGCPLVLADIDTFRELWDGAACFVPADDAAGFAEAIEAIIGDDRQRLAMEALSAERARRYRPEATARAMLGHYMRLLETRVAA